MGRRDLNTGDESRSRAEALRSAVKQHAAALELYARQFCDTPQDVVQDAFVRLAQQSRSPAQTANWLYRVVRNAAISAARSSHRRRRRETEAAAGQQAWFESANGHVLDAQTATEALRALPIEQREIIVAHLWGGLTFEQIAQLIGCSSSAAHRRYVAAVAAIRERLGITDD